MPRFVLTDHAKEDVRGIIEHIRADSPQNAAKVQTKIRDAITLLSEFSHIGHTREDAGDFGLRFWPVYSYLIVYRPDAIPLRVIRVIHGARDLGRSLWRNQ
jgi:antitoxin ParD1/3/4/toxin ParE1/3/4